MKNKAIAIILVVVLLATLAFLPKIKSLLGRTNGIVFESIDWSNQTVRVSMGYKAIQYSGSVSLGDTGSSGGNGIALQHKTVGTTLRFLVVENGQTIFTKTVDFGSRKVY